MAILRAIDGIGDDHPDGPDFIRDLVWGTTLQGMFPSTETEPATENDE